MKKNNVAGLIMAITMALCMLCSCGTSNTETKNTLKDDVKKVYNLDEEGESLVFTMFEAFAGELNKLRSLKSISNDDLLQYADNIEKAHTSFVEAFSQKYEPDLDGLEGQEKETATQIITDYAFVEIESLHLTQALFDYRLNNKGSGESCFETAVNFVNQCSEFFYGTVHITDDELDQLAEAFE